LFFRHAGALNRPLLSVGCRPAPPRKWGTDPQYLSGRAGGVLQLVHCRRPADSQPAGGRQASRRTGGPSAQAAVDDRGRVGQAARRGPPRPLRDAMTIRRGKRKGKWPPSCPTPHAALELLGRERALIYKTLVLTGLRKGELASLTVGSCILTGRRHSPSWPQPMKEPRRVRDSVAGRLGGRSSPVACRQGGRFAASRYASADRSFDSTIGQRPERGTSDSGASEGRCVCR